VNRHDQSAPRRPAAARPAAAALGLALLLTGCGIRATSVPVDAGAAPARHSCDPPADEPPGTADTIPVQVYLVCSQRLTPVPRSVPGRTLDAVSEARMLLQELQRVPLPAEVKGGFASDVPARLSVTAGDPGDPAGTLRLDRDPVDLPAYAVGQLVCTLTGTTAGSDGLSVLLGGPLPGSPVRRYACDDALRTDPDAGPTAGTVLP